MFDEAMQVGPIPCSAEPYAPSEIGAVAGTRLTRPSCGFWLVGVARGPCLHRSRMAKASRLQDDPGDTLQDGNGGIGPWTRT
jgi:hypothetical protein